MNSPQTISKTVGVLGGMGPYATVMFMQNVMELTNAKKDWDHVRLIVDQHPHVPSRSRAVLYGETSPVPEMVSAIQKLGAYPVDAVVIPCNSACYWVPEIRKQVRVPVINMIEIAANEFCRKFSAKKVSILGGAVTHQKATYRLPLVNQGREYIEVPEVFQKEGIAFIERVKNGETGSKIESEFVSFVERAKKEIGFEGLILACTEFTAFKNANYTFPVLDSSDELARFVVEFAKQGRPVPFDTDGVQKFWEKRAEMLDGNQVGFLQSTMLTSDEKEANAKWERELNSFLDRIGSRLTAQDDILELGCGLGRWSRELAKHVKHIDALDSCAKFIEKARETSLQEGVRNVDFHVANIGEFRPSKKYDHTISIALLHYLSDEQFSNAVSVVRDAVKPGGYALFRESFGLEKRFELHGFYSSVLDSEYSAIYRTTDELAAELGPDFEKVIDELTLAATQSKPETGQKVVIFKRSGKSA